jgi:hypothetical protein
MKKASTIILISIFSFFLYSQIEKMFFSKVSYIDERENYVRVNSNQYISCQKQFNVCGFLNQEKMLKMVIQKIKEEQLKSNKRCSLMFIDNAWLDVSFEEDEFQYWVERREKLTFLNVFFGSYEQNQMYKIEFKDHETFNKTDYEIKYQNYGQIIKLDHEPSKKLSLLNKFISLIEAAKTFKKHEKYSYLLTDKNNKKLMSIDYSQKGENMNLKVFDK